MRSLYILRHAKSDWSAGVADHERDLNARGERAARTVGRLLARIGQTPDEVLVSSALRTRRTLELASAAGSWSAPTRILAELYESYPDRVLDSIRSVRTEVQRLLVVGHEPTSSELTSRLCAFEDGRGGASFAFPTAVLARIDFDAPAWSTVEYGRGQLVFLIPPKLFPPAAFEFAE